MHWTPASSVDTFFACTLMVILIASAMVSTAKVVQPYLNDLANTDSAERYWGLAEYLLLNAGTPSDWGKDGDLTPLAFGLASETSVPYGLDLDKVSRLNGDNVYALSYREVLAALGTDDISLNIKIQPLFEVTINLTSSQSNGTETIYTFRVSTSKSGFPVSAWLRCYAVVEDYIATASGSTASEGIGFVNATLPNSLSGAALLVVFAKAEAYPQAMSFNAYSFGHNSAAPQPNGTFLRFSPLNHILNVSFQYPAVEVSNAYVFTYSYSFNLSQMASGNQTLEYSIPRLLENSPMVLVLNGDNASSTSFIEWTAYPQLPLEIGADFTDLTARSGAVASTYVVSVNSVLYEAVITCRSVQNIDA